jgi:hypothetical protein
LQAGRQGSGNFTGSFQILRHLFNNRGNKPLKNYVESLEWIVLSELTRYGSSHEHA